MTKQIIDIGTAANDGTGDTLRDAFDKTNDNFTEVYTDIDSLSNVATSGSYEDLVNEPDLDLYVQKNNANNNLTITAKSINFTASEDVQNLAGDSIRLYANTNVTIETEGTGVSYFWIFRSDGALTFPDGTTQETGFQATQSQISQWDEAYSWSDHAEQGYYDANTNLIITNEIQTTNLIVTPGENLKITVAVDPSTPVNYVDYTIDANNVPIALIETNTQISTSSTLSFQEGGATLDLTNANVIGATDLFENNETDPIFSASPAASITNDDLNDFRNMTYTANNTLDWTSPAPSTVGEALDRLAAVVKTLNGGTGA